MSYPFLRAYFLCDDDFGFLFADLMTYLMTFLAPPRADPDFFGDWPGLEKFLQTAQMPGGCEPRTDRYVGSGLRCWNGGTLRASDGLTVFYFWNGPGRKN